MDQYLFLSGDDEEVKEERRRSKKEKRRGSNRENQVARNCNHFVPEDATLNVALCGFPTT